MPDDRCRTCGTPLPPYRGGQRRLYCTRRCRDAFGIEDREIRDLRAELAEHRKLAMTHYAPTWRDRHRRFAESIEKQLRERGVTP